MIRDLSTRQTCQQHPGLSAARRLPLIALLVATSTAAIAACSSDDSDSGGDEAAPLDSVDAVDVPARDLPAPPPAPVSRGNTPNGLALPEAVLDWRVIGVVNVVSPPAMAATLRVVVGNDTAVNAARSGQTNPWPNGTRIGHFQWAAGTNPDYATMTAPGDFARITMMAKDSNAYPAADGGWAYGVWNGNDLLPFAAGADRACVECHTTRVAANDYVFTVPGALPAQSAVDAAPDMPNGVTMPADILDWRVIGAASRETEAMGASIRAVIGNDIAVEAARAGDTNPWPDGSMLAHYVWNIGEDLNSPDTVNAGSFRAITLMVKDSEEFAADGGWAFGNWTTLDLAGQTNATFDQACIDCHTSEVGVANDFVFTRPGALPTDLFAEQPQAL